MNIRLLLGTGVRIFSMFLFLEATTSLISLLTTAKELYDQITVGGYGAYFVIFIYYLMAVITWKFPMIITKAVLPTAPKELESVSVPPIELAKVGCALLGLFIVIDNAWAVIPLLYQIDQAYTRDVVGIARLYSLVAALIMGMFLFFKNKKIAEFMCK